MSRRSRGAFCAGLFLGAGILTFGSSARATNYIDYYYGGTNAQNPGPVGADVIAASGDHAFDIASMDVSIVGTTLNVTIHTNYAGLPGTAAAQQTNYGALFISTGPVLDASNQPIIPTSSNHYALDQYTSSPRFNYAVVLPSLGSGDQSGNDAKLYDVTNKSANVQLSYWPNPGQITNPPNAIFRNNQAVGVTGNIAPIATNESYNIDQTAIQANGTISFTLYNMAQLLGPTFALAWEMTCANDVILVNVNKSDVCDTCGSGQAPVPAALPLFAGGLGFLGFLSSRRKRRLAKLAA